MFNESVITIFTILNVWFGDGQGVASQAQIAQATSERAATDRVAAQVVSAEARGEILIRRKTGLLGVYETQLKEVDRLKRRRASWRRDRLLRQQMANSHKTARELASIDRQLRKLTKRIRGLRGKLIAAVGSELGKSPARQRRQRLISWRARARRFLRPRSKKIVLPDSSVDPLADPEDLEEQAAQLAQTEKRLAREMSNLRRRADRFRRMDRLRRLRARAAQLRRMDNNRPRRVTGRLSTGRDGSGAGPASVGTQDTNEGSPSPGSDDGFNADPSLDESNPVVVLANVVNGRALNALRRAQTSSDPLVKARAAERARKQVVSRLKRLRQQRKLIIKRARTLKRRRR